MSKTNKILPKTTCLAGFPKTCGDVLKGQPDMVPLIDWEKEICELNRRIEGRVFEILYGRKA